ncbi:MAG: lysine-2,3-aminomutase-like protein [Alphaproteobacteria bacterium]|nr:lysine-2,3-aminomutase-like protein [Alphaproteobacteria bacterium]
MPARTIRDASALIAAGLMPEAARAEIEAVAGRYAIALTPAVAALIARAPDGSADPADPIARQYLPDPAELAAAPYEHPDPIGDAAHSPVKGIVHRYPDRVLLKPLLACPVYCRFCFRRETVGPDGGVLGEAELAAALGYIARSPAIWEVILTGGDPLMLSPRRLGALIAALDAISHVQVIRLHSRVPVADPSRIDAALVAALSATAKAVWVGVHVNHPRELAGPARAALARLAQAGLPLVSQTVLLRGVNDDPAVLEELFRTLVAARVKPYYLHHLDPAPGTGHFRVPLARGQGIASALRGRVSGLAQPTYVLDVPGGFGKAPIGACALAEDQAGRWQVTDPQGRAHTLPFD